MNLYWTYQHPVLGCIHKEAFLEGMKVGRGPYFSRCLMYCILASGARISERPEIRAMTLPPTEQDKLVKRSVTASKDQFTLCVMLSIELYANSHLARLQSIIETR